MIKNKIPVEYKFHDPTLSSSINLSISLNTNDINSMYLIHRSFIQQIKNEKQGSANSKTRSEVRGGGKKPWKQKGTGKARAGSIRSPLWKGGGVVFGPKPKSYKSKVNQKEKKIAICSLLVNKKPITIPIQDNVLILNRPKTKLIYNQLQNLSINTNKKILIIINQLDNNLYLATRNIPNIELILANQLNINSLLKAENILITYDSLLTIEERYNV
uniref:Large ribosomal subunit protein uL4c n=1 Tax=Galaxaura rugosa TaxID=268570 RepID=A0A1G4NT32_9FLOR|nr:Ribosomal protein L4 [Galaxaura rugosa]SCW21797.1 Ribosomal protein L4 [Galaxaura rugosa]